MKAPENLAPQMVEKTNDQLQEMFQQPDDWLPEALEAAERELKQRGIEVKPFRPNNSTSEIIQSEKVKNSSLPAKKISYFAIISLALAGSSIFTPLFLGSLGGIIFGHLALWQIKNNSQIGGKNIAICGLVIGYGAFALIAVLACLTRHMFKGF